jgi:hypothetical protein
MNMHDGNVNGCAGARLSLPIAEGLPGELHFMKKDGLAVCNLRNVD